MLTWILTFWSYGNFQFLLEKCRFHNLSFSARCGWEDKFITRYKLPLWASASINQKLLWASASINQKLLWASASINQKLLEQLCFLIKFYADVTRFMRIEKHPFSLANNMDETPAFLTWSHQNVLQRKVIESVWFVLQELKRNIWWLLCQSRQMDKCFYPLSFSSEKLTKLSVILTLLLASFSREEKAWMDDDLMKVWFEDIWLKHTQAQCKRLVSQYSMWSFEVFAADLTDGVKN